MRVSYVSVLASIAVAVACATGEDVSSMHVTAFDAGLAISTDTGGAAGEPMTTGGTVGAGGGGAGNATQGDGGSTTPSSGGTTVVASGGKPSNGGTTSTAAGGKSSSSGGMASGGTSSAAGSTGSAGKAAGGKTGTAGTSGGDAGSCMMGQKFCGGLCTPPAPRVGCGLTGCDACTLMAPQNGYVTCANNQCVFDCLSGYTKSGNSCTGSGAGGGGNGSCRASSCPVCNVVSGPACCTNSGDCGCPSIPYVPQTCAKPL